MTARAWLVGAVSSGVWLAAVGLLIAIPAAGQHPPPSPGSFALPELAAPTGSSDHTFKSLTEVVNVPVTVRDNDEHLVPNLKREEFVLTEDGLVQQIKYFSPTLDVPLTLGFMVDTTICQDEGLPLEKELAQDFIRQIMQRGDQGFVLHFGAGVEFLQHLTGDVPLLIGAVDQLQIEPRPTSWARVRSKRLERGPHHLYDAIAEASNELVKSQAGRKVLILLTDGFEQDSRVSQKAALDAAERAGAIIYCIDLVDPILDMIPGIATAGRPVLAKLTGDTGGRLFWLKLPREVPEAFAQIAEELRSQYFVGYTPTNRRHDGSFRRIRVSLTNKSYTVRARPGYYALSD